MAYIDNICSGGAENASTNYLDTDSAFSVYNEDDGEMCLQRQSLFSHMTDELCLAIRCQGSQQRTAFKRQCSKCRQIQKRFNQQQNIDLTSMEPNKLSAQQTSPANITSKQLATLTPPPPPPSSSSTITQYTKKLYSPANALNESFEMKEFPTLCENSI